MSDEIIKTGDPHETPKAEPTLWDGKNRRAEAPLWTCRECEAKMAFNRLIVEKDSFSYFLVCPECDNSREDNEFDTAEEAYLESYLDNRYKNRHT